MRRVSRYLSSLLLATAFLAPAVTTGCANRPYRVYDPYYSDYHRWDHHEDVYYQQWTTETHRDRHDFRQLDRDQQKEYWTWRHNHDHDHDHDHDRH